jgi:hypothetical protein
MAYDFPASPSAGQVFNNWMWDAVDGKWIPNSKAGGFSIPPCGRITLQSNTPVMINTVLNAATVYWTPYKGSTVQFYSGSAWYPKILGQIASPAFTDTTKNPVAIGANFIVDWFLWDDAGTARLSHSRNWSNATTRSEALAMQDGILMNAVSLAPGPAAMRGIYVGTTNHNASSNVDWRLTGGAASGPAILNIWNMYNRIQTATSVKEGQFAITSNYVDRVMNGNANNATYFVVGLQEDFADFSINSRILLGPPPANLTIGIGFDGNTSSVIAYTWPNTVNGAQFQAMTSVSAQFFGARYAQARDYAEIYTAGGNNWFNVSNFMNFSSSLMM